MRTVIGLLLWTVMILGALPRSGQRELEARIDWWHPRLMGGISSFVEAYTGWQLLRSVLFRSELGVLGAGWAIPLGTCGLFLLVEGVLRLGVTLKMEGDALPSLPVTAVFNGVLALLRHRKDLR